MAIAGDYSYDLPPELVAQEPAADRDRSQLLVLERGGPVRGLHRFAALPDLLRPGDLLVLNDSRVLPARLWTRRPETGGQVELLLLHPEDAVAAAGDAGGGWRALARPARRLRPGQRLQVGLDATLVVTARHGAGEVTVTASGPGGLAALAERHGDVPLPPYIHRDREAAGAAELRGRDRERYQTVYARPDTAAGGSVAAPTAGLHFTPDVLARLAQRGIGTARVTLHVGPGTFRPPTPAQIAARRLHRERFVLPAATAGAIAACRAAGGRVIAVGTTSLRVLETVARLDLPAAAAPGAEHAIVLATGPGAGPGGEAPCDGASGLDPDLAAAAAAEAAAPVFAGAARREDEGWAVAGTTRLFLRPPDTITAADGLLTNFHLPGSSLLMLVAALTGERSWRAAYAEAVARRLRFFSYGDAMLVVPVERSRS